MINIQKKLKGLCAGLALISVISISPTIANASELNLLHGWVYQQHSWYHYDFGQKETGWLKDKGKWYFLNSSGVMETGWLQVNGSWYYFNSDGSMASNITIDGYYLGSDGAWVS